MSQLYPYQEQGVDFITKKRRVILADEMGLGKTLQALKAIDRADRYPALIVVGLKIAFGVWQSEIKKWLGADSLVYTGTPMQRNALWTYWEREQTPFIITNSAHIKEILERRRSWRAVVFDEYHLMGLRNRKSQTFQAVRKLYSGMLILSSGSPMSQGPQDLWPALHLINPKKFSSFWQYVNRYCVIEDNGWGKEIKRYPKRPAEMRELLSQYMIRRSKKEVLTDLPEKTRQIIPLNMTRRQHTLYRQLAREMVAEADDGQIVFAPSVLAKLTRLRQLLVSPLVLGIAEKGAGLEAVKDLVDVEFEAGNSVAIFTPFRDAADIIAKEMRHHTRHVFTVKGNMKQEDFNKAINTFQTLKTPKKVLVATIKSAVSFTAHAASVGIFLGQEWDYNDNVQAEDRLHRVGQKNAVRIYYIKHDKTLDQHVLDTLMDKRSAINITLQQDHILPS